MAVRSWFSYLYGYTLTPHEATAARHGFTAFGFVLSSYFILLPLREDVALSLGPSVLPRLFTASLFVTAIAAPAATAYVLNPARLPRAVGFARLCKLMAGCLVGLFCALLVTSPDRRAIARLLGLAPPLRPDGAIAEASATAIGHLAGHPAAVPLSPGPATAAPPALSWYGNAVRVCFYVYLSLQSLLSTSAMWAGARTRSVPPRAPRCTASWGQARRWASCWHPRRRWASVRCASGQGRQVPPCGCCCRPLGRC